MKKKSELERLLYVLTNAPVLSTLVLLLSILVGALLARIAR